jgi:hypothetical protein
MPAQEEGVMPVAQPPRKMLTASSATRGRINLVFMEFFISLEQDFTAKAAKVTKPGLPRFAPSV